MKKNLNRKFNKKMRLFNSLEEASPKPFDCKKTKTTYEKTCKNKKRFAKNVEDQEKILKEDKNKYLKKFKCTDKEYERRLNLVFDNYLIIIDADPNVTPKDKNDARAVIKGVEGGEFLKNNNMDAKIEHVFQKQKLEEATNKIIKLKEAMNNASPKCTFQDCKDIKA